MNAEDPKIWFNTKLLILASLFIIVTGLGFLLFGRNQVALPPSTPSPYPTRFAESSPVATSSATFGITGERAVVTKVVDGDTIVVNNSQTVRLIGIDTPETVDPRRPVGCFGKEASNETKSLLSGKEVILQKDVSETDKYKRLLRYVFLPLKGGQTLFVNDYLAREGFAKVLTYAPDVKYNEQFRQAEIEAREGERGLWDKCK